MKLTLPNQLRIAPDEKPRLAKRKPRDTFGIDDREAAEASFQELAAELGQLQYDLFVEDQRSVLIVLQAMDAGGKDGTIRRVMHAMNPQGARVAAFKKPTEKELSHDFLWRVHRKTPERGEVVIFNRSHYEDVLVVRVHDWIDTKTCKRRYDQINAFENLLATEGRTEIVKIYLHISPEEQLERFKDRLDEPAKHWKLNVGDYEERKLWPKYRKAFEDAITATSTKQAPWYVVPADRKWFRNLAVAQILVDTMRRMKLKPPPAEADLDEIRACYEEAVGNPIK